MKKHEIWKKLKYKFGLLIHAVLSNQTIRQNMNPETNQTATITAAATTAAATTTKTKRTYKVKKTASGGGGGVGGGCVAKVFQAPFTTTVACVAAPSIPAEAMSVFYAGGGGPSVFKVDDFETEQRRREMFNEQIGATWRAWAKSDIPYTADFPEALLTFTEFIDNSLGKGKATKVWVEIIIIDSHRAIIRIRDNGIGIDSHGNLERFITIASPESSDGNHRYGMGRFCALTKFAPTYSTAKWCATFKFDENTSHMKQISYPWSSPSAMMNSMKKIQIDDSNRDIGLEMEIEFNPSEILKDLAMNPTKLFEKMKERLTTKYGNALLESFELDLTVRYSTTVVVTENSRRDNWKSFEQTLNELPSSSCSVVFNKKIKYANLDVQVTQYRLGTSKKCPHLIALKKAFPTFGSRNENGQRVHIYNDDRLIESRAKYLMDGRKGHDTQNDEIVILKTVSTPETFYLQPEPSTIKVSVLKNCKNLENIYRIFREEFKKEKAIAAAATAAQKEKSVKVPKSKKISPSVDGAVAASATTPAAAAVSESQQRSQGGDSEYQEIELVDIDEPSLSPRHSDSGVSITMKKTMITSDQQETLAAVRQMYLKSSGDVEQFMAEFFTAWFGKGSGI